MVKRKAVTKKAKKAASRRAPDQMTSAVITLDADELAWGRANNLSEDAMLALLQEDHVDVDRDSARDRDAAEALAGTLVGNSTVTNYMSAIAELYSMQVSEGINNNPSWRGPGVKALLKARERQNDAIARENYDDRGAGGLEAGYTNEELRRLNKKLLAGATERPQVCCNLGSFL